MTPKSKQILAAVLLVGVAVVWVPQILSADTRSPANPLPEIPADGGGAIAVEPAAPAFGSNPVEPVDPGAGLVGGFDSDSNAVQGNDHDDLARSLTDAVAQAKRILPDSAGLDLDKLAAAWNAPKTIAATPATLPETSEFPVRAHESASATPPVDLTVSANPIDAFLARHPLRGTLIGSARRQAFLGPIVVNVGDEPVRGLTVTAIEQGYVLFDHAGTRVRFDLIPFQARPTANVPSSAGNTGAGASAAAAQATGANVSTGSIMGDLQKLLPLLQEAAATSAGVDSAAAPTTDSKTPAATTTGSTVKLKEQK
ncbi:MAG: hypothetical protein JNL28_01790 [Planctomycetes bacterium]|nr:hypothetical protein [Planctomycetota bacterium]